ncbi:MAG: GNAT family N-acetyltransferase [Sulfuricaulis sp.]|nr:GNAT family N-acetyltransferase [Sulfuricaulis sp.]
MMKTYGLEVPTILASRPEAMLQTDVLGAEALDGPLKAQWEALMEECESPLLFSSHDWTRAWFASFGADKQLLLITLRSAGRLVGLAPLVLSRLRRRPALAARYDFQPEDVGLIKAGGRARVVPVRQLSVAANLLSVNMRGGWLIAKEYQQAGLLALLEKIAALPDWQMLLLPSVTVTDAAAIAHAAKTMGLRVKWVARLRTLFSLRVTDWERYSAQRGRNFRKLCRQAENRMLAFGAVELRTATAPDEIATLLDEMFALARQSWKQTGRADQAVHLPVTSASTAFVRDLGLRYAAKGRCQIVVLRVDGILRGCMFCVSEGKTLYGMQTYYSSDVAYGSPGRLMMRELIQWCAAHGIERIDLNGNSPLVKTYADTEASYDQLLLFRPRGYSAVLFGLATFIGWTTSLLPRLRARGRATEINEHAS